MIFKVPSNPTHSMMLNRTDIRISFSWILGEYIMRGHFMEVTWMKLQDSLAACSSPPLCTPSCLEH